MHAPDAGNLIIEIQQNSDLTFRLYDWDRTGLDNKPRELHIDQALDVIDWESNYKNLKITPGQEKKGTYSVKNYTHTSFFTVRQYIFSGTWENQTDERSFLILIATDGEGTIRYNRKHSESISTGDLLLIPARLGDFLLTSDTEMSVLGITHELE